MDVSGHVHPSAAFLNLDLIAPVALLACAGLTRRSRDGALLVLAAATMALVATPPLHDLAARSVTGHMVQHLVILLVAAPLIGVAAATSIGRVRRRPPLRHAARLIGRPAAPLVAGLAHAAAVLMWHVPGPYDAAVEVWWLHGLEHATLLASGAWWWATVTHQVRRHALGASVVSLFGVATIGAAMGVFLMFAPGALYAHGGTGDQQIAGALMAGGTGFVYGGTALVLAAVAVQRLGTPRPVRVPPRARAVRSEVGTRGAARLGPIAATVLATAAFLALAPATGAADDLSTGDDETRELADSTESDGGRDLGRELFRRDCASCHGADGTGSFRGTSLTDVGTASVSYVLTSGRMPIADPDQPVRRGPSPYTDDEIAAIVDYTSTFVDGPSPPHLDLAGADAARGGEHYRLQCAACHGAEGIGGALAIEGFAPSVLHSDPDEIANVMVSGPGVMPTFAAALDDEDLADIAAYVLVLQDRPGTGISLPGGRVTEGLVAWIAAIGTLLLGARWLGTRA